MNNQFYFAVLTLVVFLAGCQGNDDRANSNFALHKTLAAAQTNMVTATSYPLKFAASQIAGDAAKVVYHGDEAFKAADWQPSAANILQAQNSDVIFVNGAGAPFADWLNRVSLPQEKICETTNHLDIGDFIMVKDHQIVHQHGPEGEHSHAYMVAHTWLDPDIFKKQAGKVADALIKTYPDKKESFSENLTQLQEQLDVLSVELKQEASSAKILLANPTLKFLTRAAGIEADHLLWFDDKENEKQLAALENYVAQFRKESQSVVHLLVPKGVPLSLDPVVSDEVRSRLNLQVHVIDAFDTAPQDGDYLSGMKANISILEEIRSQ